MNKLNAEYNRMHKKMPSSYVSSYDELVEQRNILLRCLTDVLDSLSPKELQNITGMPIEKCEKIIDTCHRLNEGKEI